MPDRLALFADRPDANHRRSCVAPRRVLRRVQQRRAALIGLGEIKRSHNNLYFHCARLTCSRGSKDTLDDLIAKYGAAFPVQALLERGVCQKCGARWPEIDCHLSPAPEAYAPRDHKVAPIRVAGMAQAETLRCRRGHPSSPATYFLSARAPDQAQVFRRRDLPE